MLPILTLLQCRNIHCCSCNVQWVPRKSWLASKPPIGHFSVLGKIQAENSVRVSQLTVCCICLVFLVKTLIPRSNRPTTFALTIFGADVQPPALSHFQLGLLNHVSVKDFLFDFTARWSNARLRGLMQFLCRVRNKEMFLFWAGFGNLSKSSQRYSAPG